MKRIFLVALVVGTGLVSFAQSNNESAVIAAIQALNQAIIQTDKSSLETLVSDQLSYGHSTGKVEDKSQFIQTVIAGPLRFHSIDISERTVTISGNEAIARENWLGAAIENGQPRQVKISVMMVWKKQKGKWKLLARQGYKV